VSLRIFSATSADLPILTLSIYWQAISPDSNDSSITARAEQTVQHRELDGALDIKLELTLLQQLSQDSLDSRLTAEPAEHEIRPSAADFNRFGFTVGMGLQDDNVLAEPQTGT